MQGRSLRDHLRWPPSLDAVWLTSPLLALTAVTLLNPIRPFDYFWALAHGRATLQLGAIPRENAFLYTLPAQEPFFNQAWLGQLFLFGGHELGGHTLNLVLLALLLATALGAMMDAALRAGAKPVHVALVAFASLPLIGLGSGVRTQMFAYPCFAIVFRHVVLGDARPTLRSLLPVAVATTLWANVHGSFVLAPAMLAVRGLVGVVQARGRGTPPRDALRRSGVELSVVLAATCLNPRGPAVYRYVVELAGAMELAGATDVAEWQPLSPFTPLGAGLLAALAAAVLVALKRRERVNAAALCVFVLFSVGSFQSQRFLAWAALSGVAVLPSSFGAAGSRAEERQGVPALNLALLAVLASGVLASVPGAPLFAYFAPCAHVPYPESRALGKETPLRIAERLAREGHAGRIFHNQAVAGVLEWALTTDRPRPVAFVDQRFELTPPRLWNEYFTIARAEPGWRELLDRYAVGTLLIDEERDRPLVEAVKKEGGWQLVAEEFTYRLYRRATPAPPSDG